MKKTLKVFLFLVSYCAGIIGFYSNKIFLLGILLTALLFFFSKKFRISLKVILIFLLMFLFGVLNSFLRTDDFDYLLSRVPLKDVTLTGTVTSLPSSSSGEFTKFYLDVEKFSYAHDVRTGVKSKTLVTLFDTKENYSKILPGEKIEVRGQLSRPKYASNPYEFSYASFLKHKNVFTRFYAEKGNFKILSPSDKLQFRILYFLNSLRSKIIAKHEKYLKSPALELLGGIVFGDDAINPTPEMTDTFRISGLTHIIAASGMNVSMIFGMWYVFSNLLGINYKFSIITGMFAVICYTCMTGFGPPVMRATLMILFILAGKLFDKKADTVRLLFVVAFILLVYSPQMIFDIGFKLSFAVTFGLLIFAPMLNERIKNKYVLTAVSACFIPFIAQLFAAPIQMFYFNTFSLYSLFANIAVIPVLSVISFVGFGASVAALIPSLSDFVVKISDLFLYPFLTYVIKVAEYFSSLPFATIITPKPSLIQIFLYFLLLISVYFVIVLKSHRKKLYKYVTVLFAIFAFTFVNIPSKNCEVIFFSVGNADASLIKLPGNKYILTDTGKSKYKNFANDAEKVILNYMKNEGIKKLDLMIISHFDTDHAGGAEVIISNIPVKKVVLRSGNDSSETAQKIYEILKRKNIDTVIPQNGDIVFRDKNTEIKVSYKEFDDDNDASITDIVSVNGKNLLFTGDASLIPFNSDNEIPSNIEILKVPHHGAKDVINREFLENHKIRYAVISSGTNIYGHPAKETVELLNSEDVKTFNTQNDNAVKIVLSENKTDVFTFNSATEKFERNVR